MLRHGSLLGELFASMSKKQGFNGGYLAPSSLLTSSLPLPPLRKKNARFRHGGTYLKVLVESFLPRQLEERRGESSLVALRLRRERCT